MVNGSDVRKSQSHAWYIKAVQHNSRQQPMIGTSQKKPKIIYNAFEQTVELGKDTARKAVYEITKTFNPLDLGFEHPTNAERKKGNNNFTDLDFDKLQKQYDQQDSSKLDAVRAQLDTSSNEQQNPNQLKYNFHRRVMREEEEYNAKKEQEEEEKKRQEALEEQQKKQATEETKKKQSAEITPRGRIRRSILGGKSNLKSSTELPPELKPDAGKQ